MSQPTKTATDRVERRRELRWSIAMVAMILLTVVGVVVNVESTEVYMNLRIAPHDYVSSCNINERVNCEEVEKSEWAAFLGVPTSLWAIVGYGVIGALALVSLCMRRRREWGFLFLLSLFSVGLGLFLIYLMAFEIGSWCTLCLATDAVNLGLLVMVLLACWVGNRSPFQAVNDDLRWLWKSPLALVGHLALGGLMIAAAFGVTETWIDPPIEEAMRKQAQEMVKSLTLDGVDRDVALLEKQRNPGVNPDGQPWAGEAIPSEACPHPEEECTCEAGSAPQRKKVTIMGEDEHGHEWIGAPDPVLEIHEFTDYECPHCRRAHMRMRRLLSKYPGQIRLIHRHFPLDSECNPMLEGKDFHERACEFSRVAYCAGEQGRFWEMNDLLFQRQSEILDGGTPAEDLARRLELDVDRFQCCMTSDDTAAHIAKDLETGIGLEITGTPAFVVGDEMYLGKVPTTVLKVLTEE